VRRSDKRVARTSEFRTSGCLSGKSSSSSRQNVSRTDRDVC